MVCRRPHTGQTKGRDESHTACNTCNHRDFSINAPENMPDAQIAQGNEAPPAFAEAAALAAVGGQAALLRQVAEVFLMHHTAVCHQLDQALANADHAQLREIAHDLKGMGASIGAQALSTAARTVEAVVAFGASDDLDQSIAAMRAELEQVRVVMAAVAQA